MSNTRKEKEMFPGRKRANKHMMFVHLKKSMFSATLDLMNKKTFIAHDYAPVVTSYAKEECNLG